MNGSSLVIFWTKLYPLLLTSIIFKCDIHNYQHYFSSHLSFTYQYILKCDFKNYQDYFLIEYFRYIMPRKYNSKRKRLESSTSLDQSSKAKSLKELELQNEVIYNKKHIWMRRVFIDFINDRFPRTHKPKTLYPDTRNICYIWMVIHVIPTIGCSIGGF